MSSCFEADLVNSPLAPDEVRGLAEDLGLTIDLYQPFRDFEAVPAETFERNLRRAYFTVVWCMVVFGSAILLLGFDQPLVLVTISTVLGGAIMFVYTCLLLVTNRRYLPAAIRPRGYRIGILLFAGCDARRHDGDRGRRPDREPPMR